MSFKGLLSQIPSGLMPKDASEEDLHDLHSRNHEESRFYKQVTANSNAQIRSSIPAASFSKHVVFPSWQK